MTWRGPVLIGCMSVLALGCGDDAVVDSGQSPSSDGNAPGTTGDDATSVVPEDSTGVATSGMTSDDSTSSVPTTTTTATGVDSSSGGPLCGDDVAEGDEICDGTDLGGQDCIARGFEGGVLGCADDCSGFDTSNCSAANCGNGVVEGAEACDGVDLAEASCVSEGFDSGQLGCALNCAAFDTDGCGLCGNVIVDGDEVCDDIVLFGETCLSQGFDSGQLGCASDCLTYVTTGCGTCDNGFVDGAESCDGVLLDGQDCLSQGFDSGTLSCQANCAAFETEGCGACGNDLTDGDEVCDGIDVAGDTCVAQGFDSGTLMCQPDCSGIDLSSCGTCGNGVADGSEPCDTMDLGGQTCMSLGLGGGTLACQPTCLYDSSLCDILGGAMLTVRTGDDVLRAIDPMTLAIADVGPLGVDYDFGEVAWDGTTGTLWMVDGRPLEALYTVDLGTGAANLVGIHGIEDLFGLAHDPTTGILFGSGESPTGLYSMNTMTGAPTFIGDPGVAADGLTYDPLRDQIVGLAGGGGDLHAIDRLTGMSTLLSSEGFINNCGLAYNPIGDVYWSIDWSGNVYQFDPNAGYTRTLLISGLDPHDGLTFVPGFVVLP